MNTNNKNISRATFAGWCFWCLEGIFASTPGVISTQVGYAWGEYETPTYEDHHGHREAIEIEFDETKISYEDLVILFFTQIDPTDSGGQFWDRWYSYTTAIWYHSVSQKKIAEEVITRIDASKKFLLPVAVKLEFYNGFYRAEEYHQRYFEKQPFRYSLYHKGSGREDYIEENWNSEIVEYIRWKDALLAKKYKKPIQSEIKERLTDEEYRVTQESGTERPYTSEFALQWKEWIYVDRVSGEPLFSSLDQYNAWCGWPSFTRPIHEHFMVQKEDCTHGMRRIEVRSKYADSHLGHVFDDGPIGSTGLRYCINGAALRFIPLTDLVKEGYGEYEEMFR